MEKHIFLGHLGTSDTFYCAKFRDKFSDRLHNTSDLKNVPVKFDKKNHHRLWRYKHKQMYLPTAFEHL